MAQGLGYSGFSRTRLLSLGLVVLEVRDFGLGFLGFCGKGGGLLVERAVRVACLGYRKKVVRTVPSSSAGINASM